MNSGRDSKSDKPISNDDAMRAVLTAGQSHILPDAAGKKKVTVIREALSSYYATTQPKKPTTSSTSISSTASNEKSASQGLASAMNPEIESSVKRLPLDKKKIIKPLRPLPSSLDNTILNRVDHKSKKVIDRKYQEATIKNAQLNFFKKLPNAVFELVSNNLDVSAINAANRACIETNRLFQNQMRDERKAKQPLLQKLLQYVVDADKDHAEEFIKWHYRFQLVTPEEKMPEPPEQDVIYVEKKRECFRIFSHDIRWSMC